MNFYQDIPSPCYVLEEHKLIKNLELLRYVQQQADVKILVALKGYAMHSTFGLLANYLAGGTASSLHEAMLINNKMNAKAHLCCPVYLDAEIEQIIGLGSHITFNSLSQLQKFGPQAYDANLKVAIRINPEYSEVKTALYNPCMPGSRLGVINDLLPDTLPPYVSGLHFHALCEDDSFTLAGVLDAIEQKFGKYLGQISWFNFGGGHHITRADYDVEHLIETLKKFKTKYPNIKDIYLEPGEAVGWQTGFLLTTVVDIVENRGYKTAMLDASFTCHMPDCLEMPYKPAVRGENQDGSYKYRLGGMSCLSGDFIEGFAFDEPLQIGQQIIFEDMIHYTMVKTTTFNGIGLPAIGKLNLENKFELIKQYGYNEYADRLS